jgi:hypothetical protein
MGAIVASYVHVTPPDPRVKDEFVQGFHHAVLVGAGFALLAAVIAVTFVRKIPHHEGQPALEGA